MPASPPGRRAIGRLVVVAAVAAAALTLPVRHAGPTRASLGAAWQLLDLGVLGDDPIGGLWHLHTQPPLHNAVVALVLWLPVPVAGTLFALYVGCLLATGLLLADLLVRWSVGPVVAGGIAAFAVVDPSLLATIRLASYEVPAAALVVAALHSAQRHLERPEGSGLVVAAVVLTLAALTRSLLHPLCVAGVLLVLVAARPVPRRRVLAVAAIPAVALGGWALKNDALFGTPTLTSWTGFNLQRGVTGPMDEDHVRRDVATGAVSPQARVQPWQRLDRYVDRRGCTRHHDHPAVAAPTKRVEETGAVIANFNHECFLPVYDRARADATGLVARHPGRFLATRVPALAMSAQAEDLCRPETGCTWMDGLYRPLLAPVHLTVDTTDWNLPLIGLRGPLTVEVALLHAATTAFVLGRGLVGAVRLVRGRARGAGGRLRPGDEVLWTIAGWTVAVVVLGGDLVELGENGRFRAMVDPLTLTLPLAAGARAATRRWGRRSAPTVDVRSPVDVTSTGSAPTGPEPVGARA